MSARRNQRLRNLLHRRTRGLRLEPLESRTLLSASPTDDSFRLAIFANSTEVDIPAQVGVAANDSTQSLFTLDATGKIYLDTPGSQTLGDFFDIWQNHAGLAGNNADAILSEDQLLGNVETGRKTVQMFVNGQVSTEFEDYAVEDGDQIVLVYGDNPVVSLNTNYGPIVIELFADEARRSRSTTSSTTSTTAITTIRSSTGRSPISCIQGGGFKTRRPPSRHVDQFDRCPDRRGDHQRARHLEPSRERSPWPSWAANPNSATSQFFVNLTNNHATCVPRYAERRLHRLRPGSRHDDGRRDRQFHRSTPRTPRPYNELPLGRRMPAEPTTNSSSFRPSPARARSPARSSSTQTTTALTTAAKTPLAARPSTSTPTTTEFSIPAKPGHSPEPTARTSSRSRPASYVVRSEATPGRTATAPLNPDSYTVAVEIGRENCQLEFRRSRSGRTERDRPAGRLRHRQRRQRQPDPEEQRRPHVDPPVPRQRRHTPEPMSASSTAPRSSAARWPPATP